METIRSNSQTTEVEVKGQKILVKEYETSDRTRILDIFDNLMLTDEGRLLTHSRFDHRISRQSFETYLDNPILNRILLFTPENQLVGWGEYSVREDDPNRAELSRLILKDYQKRGLGTLLIDLLIDKCRLKDPNVLTMESLTQGDNYLALASLEKARKKYNGEMRYEKLAEFYYQPRYIFPIRSLK